MKFATTTTWCHSPRSISRTAGLIAFITIMALGCSKKAAPEPPSPSPSASTSPATPDATKADPAATPAVAAPPLSATARDQASFLVNDLQLSVDAFQKVSKRRPASLQELVQAGFLPALPAAPAGRQFQYDSATGKVSLSP